jgi:hypothetical protein
MLKKDIVLKGLYIFPAIDMIKTGEGWLEFVADFPSLGYIIPLLEPIT